MEVADDDPEPLEAHGLDEPPLTPVVADPLVTEVARRVARRDEDRVRLARQTRAKQPLMDAREPRGERPQPQRRSRDRAEARHPGPVVDPSERPDGHLLQAEDVRRVGTGELHHLPQEALPSRRVGVSVEDVPAPDEQAHGPRLDDRFPRPTGTVGAMHVVLADPPAFTPPYDHELAAALARAGATVELVTAPFRFGPRPAPTGYRLEESFYRRSSRIDRRRLRLAVKALEHPSAMRRLVRRTTDVLHLQWLAAPELDRALLRTRTPLVFTAHDLLPRRTARKASLWRALFARFDRIVVHSERGRETLETLGVPDDRLRVVPHPVFRSDPPRRDDGLTVLSLGVIRPYKGIEDAVEARAARPRRAPARRR